MGDDQLYMIRCLELASLGAGSVAPNPMVGAVLVYDSRIIGEGYHQQFGGPHAEVNCINSVSEEDLPSIPQATMYVSLEPCAHYGKTPPCADLIVKNHIPKVVVGCRDPFAAVDGKGIEKLIAAGVEVTMSSMETSCRAFNKRFFTFHTRQRPYIILKWAQTADGFVGTEGSRLLITNSITNRRTHQWRAEESAILIGTNTAALDNPSLTTRHWVGNNPVRLVIDKHNRLDESLALFDRSASTIVFTSVDKVSLSHVTHCVVPDEKDYVTAILNYCYQHQLQSIIVEGGATLLQSFIDANIWDEARVITNTALWVGEGVKAPILHQRSSILHQDQIQSDLIAVILHDRATLV